MKVLFVSSGNWHVGGQTFIKSQADSLRRIGVDIGHYLVVGKGIKGYLSNIMTIRKIVTDNDYDIIHAHYGLIGLLCVLSFSRKPLVLSLMGDDVYGSYNSKGNRKLAGYINMLLTQFACIFSSYLITKSKNIGKYIVQKYKLTIIPNGVDFDIFKPISKHYSRNSLQLSPDTKYILFLGDKNDPRKNYKLLDHSMVFVKNQKLEVLAPYPVDTLYIPLYLNACDMLVLTSFNEGSPNIIKEAMECNTPIIATDVGDVREVIGNTDGCYITKRNAKELASNIDTIASSPSKTDGRCDIEHLESSVIAEEILKIYSIVKPK